MAGSVENALPRTFTLSKSRMEIEPVLANKTNAMTWKAAGIVNCVWHRLGAQGIRRKGKSKD